MPPFKPLDVVKAENRALSDVVHRFVSDDELFTAEEQGERRALLELRSFIIKHGVKDVDAYAFQRLHDIREDAKHRSRSAPLEFQR